MAVVKKAVETKEKAVAFINVSVAGKNSSKQLGGIPLYASNEFHAKLIEHLNAGGEVTLETDIHQVAPVEDFEF